MARHSPLGSRIPWVADPTISVVSDLNLWADQAKSRQGLINVSDPGMNLRNLTAFPQVAVRASNPT